MSVSRTNVDFAFCHLPSVGEIFPLARALDVRGLLVSPEDRAHLRVAIFVTRGVTFARLDSDGHLGECVGAAVVIIAPVVTQQLCMHTHNHTRPHLHNHTRAYIHNHTRAYTHTHNLIHICCCMQTKIITLTRTRTHSHMRAHALTPLKF